MQISDIVSMKEFSSDKPVKKDIIKSGNFNVVLVCLEEGQEIEPHPEPYAVFFIVLEGRGVFTGEDRIAEMKSGDCISSGAGKTRGIRCLERLVVLGVQDGH